jgi:hypothetical protein
MKWLGIFLLLAFTGCAARREDKSLPDYLVDPPCLLKPVLLEKCDFESPPHCKQVRVIYKKGCERLKVK